MVADGVLVGAGPGGVGVHEVHQQAFGQEEEERGDPEDHVEKEVDVARVRRDAVRQLSPVVRLG